MKTNQHLTFFKLIALLIALQFFNRLQGQTIPDFKDGNWRVIYGLTSGYASLQGYAIGMEYNLNKKNNSFSAVLNYNAQFGNRGKDFFGLPVFYNDKFYELGLLYGRTFQKGIFLFEGNFGPAGYIYKNKALAKKQYDYFSDEYADTKTNKGVGLCLQGSTNIILGKSVILGIKYNTNLNGDYINMAIQGRVAFFM